MSFVAFKFLPALTAGNLPATVYNTPLAANDTFLNIIGKLQGLLAQRLNHASRTSTFTGGGSSTANIGVLSMTIKAGLLVVGDSMRLRMSGVLTKPLSVGTTISIYVSVGASTVVLATLTPTGAISGLAFNFDGDVTFRTVGASGVAMATGVMTLPLTSTTFLKTTAMNSTTITGLDTTSLLGIAIGFAFSNSDPSNTLTTQNVTISMN